MFPYNSKAKQVDPQVKKDHWDLFVFKNLSNTLIFQEYLS